MLIGNVGKEPEVRYVDAGVCVASVRLATKERGYKLPSGGEVPDRTEWHNVILWRKLAEVVERYVHKGDKLYIEGRIHYASYDDKQGKRQYYTEIWADNMEMLTPKQTTVAAPEPATQTAQATTQEDTTEEPMPF